MVDKHNLHKLICTPEEKWQNKSEWMKTGGNNKTMKLQKERNENFPREKMKCGNMKIIFAENDKESWTKDL